MSFTLSDLPDLLPEYLVELGTMPPTVAVQAGVLGQPGAHAVGGMPVAPNGIEAASTVRLSLRGWTGEPGDAVMPNVAYASRLVEPPTLVRSIRILPEDSVRATFQAGEVVLDNGDGGLDRVGGDWTMAGQPAVVRRGSYRAPLRAPYAEFRRVAEMRITGAALSNANRLTVGLRDATVDLSVPLQATYLGTGGLEGDVALAGRQRPMLLGYRRQIGPMPLLATALVWQVAAYPLQAIGAVRDRGVPLTATSNYATLAALQAATVAGGQYATCLASGILRTGSPPEGQITVDAQAVGDASHAGIALSLLRGPGGLPDSRIDLASFAAFPGGSAGGYWTSGTVAAALDEIVGSVAGWWGSDREGRIVAGRLPRPEDTPAAMTVQRWMITAEPSELASVAPRWRQRVAYRRLVTVQSASDLAGLASSNPGLVAAYGTAQQIAPAIKTAVPGDSDPEPLLSNFDAYEDANALAYALLALHGQRRRRWRLPVGKWGHLIDVGDVIAVDHPRLSANRWVVTGTDEAGDAKTLSLWG